MSDNIFLKRTKFADFVRFREPGIDFTNNKLDFANGLGHHGQSYRTHIHEQRWETKYRKDILEIFRLIEARGIRLTSQEEKNGGECCTGGSADKGSAGALQAENG